MKKIYNLKPWDEVENHHFISKERWDALANAPALEVELLNGFLTESAMIYPKGTNPTIANVFLVTKGDLREVIDEVPTEKTYTKADVRKAAMRVVEDSDLDEDEAIASAVAMARLIKELN